LFNTVVSPFAIASTDNLTLFSLFISTKSTTESEQLHRASWRKENHENWLDAFFLCFVHAREPFLRRSCNPFVPNGKLQSLSTRINFSMFPLKILQSKQVSQATGQVRWSSGRHIWHMKFEIETHRLLQSQWTQNVLMLIDIHTERAKSWAGCSSDHCCVQYVCV
jgi:hypothetical protein